MEVTSAQRASWFISALLLTAGLRSIIDIGRRFFPRFHSHHAVTRSFILLLIPDIVTIFNYLPHHIIKTISNEFHEDGWCKFTGFISVSSVFVSNMGSVGIAFISKNALVMESTRFMFDSPNFLYGYMIFSWIIGFVFAGFLSGDDRIGSYRGLYCCVRDTTDPGTTIPLLLFWTACQGVMHYFYFSLKNYVKDQDPFVVEAVTLHAFRMSSIYYCAWAVCAFMGLVAVCRGDLNYPIWLDVLAVWLIKTGPILNCVVLDRALSKAEAHDKKKKGSKNDASKSEAPMDRSSKVSPSGTLRVIGGHPGAPPTPLLSSKHLTNSPPQQPLARIGPEGEDMEMSDLVVGVSSALSEGAKEADLASGERSV